MPKDISYPRKFVIITPEKLRGGAVISQVKNVTFYFYIGKNSNFVKIDLELFIFSPDTNFFCKLNLIFVSILTDLAYKIKGAVVREVSARNVAESPESFSRVWLYRLMRSYL